MFIFPMQVMNTGAEGVTTAVSKEARENASSESGGIFAVLLAALAATAEETNAAGTEVEANTETSTEEGTDLVIAEPPTEEGDEDSTGTEVELLLALESTPVDPATQPVASIGSESPSGTSIAIAPTGETQVQAVAPSVTQTVAQPIEKSPPVQAASPVVQPAEIALPSDEATRPPPQAAQSAVSELQEGMTTDASQTVESAKPATKPERASGKTSGQQAAVSAQAAAEGAQPEKRVEPLTELQAKSLLRQAEVRNRIVAVASKAESEPLKAATTAKAAVDSASPVSNASNDSVTSVAATHDTASASKVGTAPDHPVHVRATLHTLGDTIVRHVRLLTHQGERTMVIKLVPESLGEIQIEVRTGSDHSVVVRMLSASPAIRETLEEHAALLRHALSQDGFENAQVDVSSGEDLQSGPKHDTSRFSQSGKVSTSSTRSDIQTSTNRPDTRSQHEGVLNVLA